MHKEQYILEAYSKEKNNALICITRSNDLQELVNLVRLNPNKKYTYKIYDTIGWVTPKKCIITIDIKKRLIN